MKLPLNIREKTLVLVAVPLLFEFVFVSWLWILVQQAEQTFDRLQDSKDMLIQVQRTKGSLAQAIATALLSNAADDPAAVNALNDAARQLQESRQEIASHRPRRPDIAQQLSDIDRLLERGVNFSRRAASVFADTTIEPDDRGKHLRKELYALLRDAKPASDGLLKHELNIQQMTPAKLQQDQLSIMVLLAVGVVISTVIAGSLAAYFGRNFGRRLTQLSSDARLLAFGLPLPEPPEQLDEIGALHTALYESSLSLNEYKRKAATFAENASDVVCSLDSDGVFLYASPASMKIWWVSPADLTGRSVYDMIPLEKQEQMRAALRSAKSEPQSLETRFRREDGFILDVLWSISWSDDKSSYFCLAHDITEEADLARLKRRFLSMVSHDLRTPIASVSGSLTLLSDGARGQLSSSDAQQIDLCTKKLQDVNQLLSCVLDLEKLDSGKLVMRSACASFVDIYSLCMENVQALAIERGVTLGAPDKDVAILVDAQRVEQAITAFMRHIVLSSATGSQLAPSVASGGSYAMISLPAPGLESLSSPFDADAECELATAIVKAHQGHVAFDATTGRMWIHLPAFPDEGET